MPQLLVFHLDTKGLGLGLQESRTRQNMQFSSRLCLTTDLRAGHPVSSTALITCPQPGKGDSGPSLHLVNRLTDLEAERT